MAETISMAAGRRAFANRTVIVSGAAGTIGRTVCAALGAAGANIVVNDINTDGVNDLVRVLNSLGGSAHGVAISATCGHEIINQTIEKFGAVHAIINATLGGHKFKPFEELTDDDFRNSFESNVMGPLSIIRAAWPYFKAQNFGRVVNFTSDSMLGMPTASNYTFSKGALFGVNKTLAMEGRPHNIMINCVSPIAYKSNMEQHIASFSDDTKHAFRTMYKPGGNVPMILALVSDSCEVSGEVFHTAGWAVGRNVWGVVRGENGMDSMEECLRKMGGLCKKNERDVFEPGNMVDFTEFQAKYVLGK